MNHACSFVSLLLFISSSLTAEEPETTRAIQNLNHNISTLDQEFSILRQKFQSQEQVLDSIHKEVTQLIRAAKESQAKSTASTDTRLKAMEKNIEKLVHDLKQFKKHANESTGSLSQLQKAIHEQEEIAKLQTQQIKDLEEAMRLLASAMQTKSSSTKKGTSQYQVKSGDTLEKIAKEHGTTIDAIKAENNLQKDTIFSGQKLQIP